MDTTVGREYFYEAKKCVIFKQYQKAKQLFKFVIELRPDAASPHYHLGCLLVELNKLKEAVSHFKQAFNIKPDVTKYQQLFTRYNNMLYLNDGRKDNSKRNIINDENEENKDEEKNESESTQEKQKCHKSDNNQPRICCEYQSQIMECIKECEPSMINDICWIISEYIVSVPFGDKVDENPYFKEVQSDYNNFQRALSFAWESSYSWVVNEKDKFKLLPNEPKLHHVSEIYFAEKGENDILPWIIIGKYDKYYFCMRAGCDYTGWDCLGNYGKITFASHWCNFLLFGLTDSIRWRCNGDCELECDADWMMMQQHCMGRGNQGNYHSSQFY